MVSFQKKKKKQQQKTKEKNIYIQANLDSIEKVNECNRKQFSSDHFKAEKVVKELE